MCKAPLTGLDVPEDKHGEDAARELEPDGHVALVVPGGDRQRCTVGERWVGKAEREQQPALGSNAVGDRRELEQVAQHTAQG